jgi:hypothetical protein
LRLRNTFFVRIFRYSGKLGHTPGQSQGYSTAARGTRVQRHKPEIASLTPQNKMASCVQYASPNSAINIPGMARHVVPSGHTSDGPNARLYRELPRLLDPARLPPPAPAAPLVVGRMFRNDFTKSARWSSE